MIEALRFDGYLTNYTELCAKAGLPALPQNEENLKALTAGCYRMWGKNLLSHMDGGFFVALYDSSSEEYLIGRDRFGIRGGYYACRKGMPFRFGTSPVEVLRAARIRPAVDEKSLQLYLMFSFVPGPGTLFEGVSKLLPGEFAVYKKGQLTKRRYWQPEYSPKTGVSLDDWAAQLDKTLRQSVKETPRGKVTHGLLSSGVDSAYLTAVSNTAHTHTACFRDSAWHEETGAQETAAALGVENELHLIDPDRYLRSIPEVLRCLEEPLGDASEPALYLMCKELQGRCDTVYSAEGIDEMFGGYHSCRAALRRAPYWVLPGPLRRAAAGIAGQFPGLPGSWLMLAGERDITEHPGNTVVFGRSGIRKILNGKPELIDPYETVRECCPTAEGADMVTLMCDHDLRLGFANSILLGIDRISAGTGIRFCMPFVSRRVFELAASIPSGHKVTRSTGKLVFRRAAAHALPEEICRRRKIGFETPVCVWLQQERFGGRVREAFETPAAARWFKKQQLDLLWKRFLRRPDRYWHQIWTIYMFLQWEEIFIENKQESAGRSPERSSV